MLGRAVGPRYDVMRYKAAVRLQVCPTPKVELPFLAILIHRVLMCSFNFSNPFLFTLFIFACSWVVRTYGGQKTACGSQFSPPCRCLGQNSDCRAWCLHLLSHFTGSYFILFSKVRACVHVRACMCVCFLDTEWSTLLI